MNSHDGDWQDRSSAWDAQATGFSVLRVALLFGSIAIAIALLAVPLLQSGINETAMAVRGAGVDTMSTGSVRDSNRYIVRRSVLQPTPDSVCVIRANGTRSGNC